MNGTRSRKPEIPASVQARRLRAGQCKPGTVDNLIVRLDVAFTLIDAAAEWEDFIGFLRVIERTFHGLVFSDFVAAVEMAERGSSEARAEAEARQRHRLH
jgi:hypothetical protein